MAASFSAASFFAIREEEDQNQMKQQHSSTPPSSSTTLPAPAPPQKKRKNHQPGTPYPDAEVIALSPKTLMATNRFVCEVCNKGFQREQNLQLHRRGHNLPWKLKQKGNNKDQQPPKRKVYLCPEPTCVHHEPSRALGDLTGVKKHFSRKHGEKKWKCDKCSKKYAVQSDWKAHSKTCGTREYRCDCGTLFSRRDSFITHRAFCDALAHESGARPPPPPPNHLSSAISISSQLYNGNGNMSFAALSEIDQNDNNMLRFGNTRTGQFNHILSPPQQVTLQTPSLFNIPAEPNQNQNQNFNLPFLPIRGTNTNTNSNINLLFSENFNNEEGSIFFPEGPLYDHSPISPHMSATALLQKAAQMGVSSSSNSCNSNNNTASSSLLRSFGGMTKSDHRAVLVSANNGNTNNMQELIMNSFAAGFEEACEYNNNNNNHHGMDHHRGDPKVETMMSIGGGSDGFTRDFLGVGEIVRNMSGGVSQREQQQQQQQQQQRGFNLEAEKNINAAPLTGQSFGGGGNFQ